MPQDRRSLAARIVVHHHYHCPCMLQSAVWQQLCATAHRHQFPLCVQGSDWLLLKTRRAASVTARCIVRQRPWLHGAAISRHVSASCRLSARRLSHPSLKQGSEFVFGGMSRGACAATQTNTHPGNSNGPPESVTGGVSDNTDVLDPPGFARGPASAAAELQLPTEADDPRISAASGLPHAKSQAALPWSESPALKFEVCRDTSQ